MCLVAAITFVAFILKFSYICGKDCTIWEEDRQKAYEEKAIRVNEDTLMEVLLEKSKERTKEDVTKALDKYDNEEDFWKEIDGIMKNVTVPGGEEKEVEAVGAENLVNREDLFNPPEAAPAEE